MFQVKIYKDQNNEVSVGTMSASQSSLWHDNKKHAASTCLDGNKVNHKGESDSHDCRTSDKTKDMVRPWWEVDLGAETTVYKVRIEQVAFRTDKEEHNLGDLDIQLISKDDVVLATADTKGGLPNASRCNTLNNDNSESCRIEFTTENKYAFRDGHSYCLGPDWFIDKYDLGLEGCLQEVVQDPQCDKIMFLYRADSNCGCIKAGGPEMYINTEGCQQANTYNIDLVPSFTRTQVHK